MAYYRFKGKSLGRADGTQIKRGQVFVPAPEELSAFGDLLEPAYGVQAPEPSPLPTPAFVLEPEEEEFVDEIPPKYEEMDTQTMSVFSILSTVEEGVLDPVRALEQERQGKQRKTLIAALEKVIQGS